MKESSKIIRLLLREGDGRESFFPVIMEPHTTLWETIAPVLPPWADLDEWILTDWEGRSDIKDLMASDVRGGAWFYAGTAEGVPAMSWREGLPEPGPFNELNVEIYHRSLVSIRKRYEIDLPSCRYLQIKVAGKQLMLLHEQGLLVGKKSAEPDFKQIVFLRGERPRRFELDETGHLFILYPGRLDLVDLDNQNSNRTLFTLPAEQQESLASELICLGCQGGDVWLMNRMGEVFHHDDLGNIQRPLGDAMPQSAVFCSSDWLVFDDLRGQLFSLRLAESQFHSVLEDNSGSVHAFCQDDHGRIYYLSSGAGLQVYHPEQGLMATMERRAAYEPFVSPKSLDVEGNRLFVLDGERLFTYELGWEEIHQ